MTDTSLKATYRPRRILMSADTIGGVWTYALELISGLAAFGVDVVLATMGRRLSPDQRSAVHRLKNVELFESSFKLEWMHDSWKDVEAAGEWLVDIARQLEPDIVHLNGYAHGALSYGAPKLVVGHSCVLSWWRAVKNADAPPEWNRYREEVARGLQGAAVVVAPSRAMLRNLEHHYGALPHARVIVNGRDIEQFHTAPKQNVVLAVGRLWDEAKNIGALDAVTPRLPVPVYVVGDTQHPDGGSARTHQVRTLGYLSPHILAQWYACAAIYALPARYEPFGLSILEAALSSCALVLGDIPSLRELWGDAALFVAPDDHALLRATIERLSTDVNLRRICSCRARGRALQYTTERMARAYMTVYSELILPTIVAQAA